jgi:hypothetical protein
MKRLLAASLLAACSSPPPGAVVLQGQALYADGSVAASQAIEFTLLASGQGLFPDGTQGCEPSDPNSQGKQILTAVTAADGSFSVSAPITGFVRATDATCFMPPQAAFAISSIEVQAAIEANAETCGPYCKIHNEDTCDPDCAGRGQKFVSTSTLVGLQTHAHIGVVFSELGPPLTDGSDGQPQADLQIDGIAAQNSLSLDQQTFTADDCVFADQCIAAPGDRKLLRFDGVIQNLGTGDLVIGNSDDNPLFTFSACHQHYQLRNIISFELLDLDGNPVFGDTGAVVGRKQGYCIEGIKQVAGDQPNTYSCSSQGLAPGWEDIYTSALDCQWLDITGVPDGEYTLRLTANPTRLFSEADYTNNSATIPVTLPLPDRTHD